MRGVQELFTLALVLIGIFLLVNNWKGTTAIISTTGGAISKNFKTLQARD